MTASAASIEAVLADGRRRLHGSIAAGGAVLLVVICAFTHGDAFDLRRYGDALPTILQLARDALPPDFSRWTQWGRPLLETLAMSVAGTALAVCAGLPLAVLAARNVVASRGWASRCACC